MKNKGLLLVLFVVTSFLIFFTVYILIVPNVNVSKPQNTHKKNEKISEIVHEEEIEMLFNIYLNNNRHRLKWVYRQVDNNLVINIYLDGKEILTNLVMENINTKDIGDIWVMNPILERDIADFTILNNKYLAFYLTNITNNMEYYYVINENGKILNDQDIIKHDDQVLNNAYLYSGNDLAKIEDNKIYYLIINDDIIEEYKLEFIGEKLVSKKIKEYSLEME